MHKIVEIAILSNLRNFDVWQLTNANYVAADMLRKESSKDDYVLGFCIPVYLVLCMLRRRAFSTPAHIRNRERDETK